MFRRGLAALVLGLLGLGMWLTPASKAEAQDVNLYYHYPFKYYPSSYWPSYTRWPDPRINFQPWPVYMAYPQQRDANFRYDILEYRRYHRGFHFFLDQF